jgi:hypothetical protein
MTGPDLNEDVILACADLAGRAGALDFEIGYVHEGVPVEDAGWYAQVSYRGARIMTDEHRSPSLAAAALAERLLAGAACRCGQPVTLSDTREGCRWRLAGRRWEPGCDAPPIRIPAAGRGDPTVMLRALTDAQVAAAADLAGTNRTERRAARRLARRLRKDPPP